VHTELTFLIELLLEHKLTKATKDAVAARIKELDVNRGDHQIYGRTAQVSANASRSPSPGAAAQAPSTLAILARNPDLAEKALAAPVPVENIAQTPAAAAALQHRADMINSAISGQVIAKGGNPEGGRKSPRKF
jgi:hypothetical protein